MPLSINGWPVLTGWGDKRLREFAVPGTKTKLLLRSDIGPLLVALAADYSKDVSNIDNRADDWGFDYRKARASVGSWSDHSSGTAIDLNASTTGAQGPHGGMATLTSDQIAAIVEIKKRYEVVIWGGDKARGGDYGSSIYWDPMHFALRPGVTVNDVRRVMAKLGIDANGVRHGVTPAPHPTPHPLPPVAPFPLKAGSKGNNIKVLQTALVRRGYKNVHVTGIYDASTQAAVKNFQTKRPSLWPADGICGPKSFAAITSK